MENTQLSIMLTPQQALALRNALALSAQDATSDAAQYRDDGVPALVNVIVDFDNDAAYVSSLEGRERVIPLTETEFM